MGRAPESAPPVSAAPSSSSVPPRAPVFYPRLASAREPMASSEEDGAGSGSVEEKEAAKKAPRRGGAVTTAWLIFYNIAMTAGWLVLAITMARFYLENGTHNGLYKSIQKILKFFQTFALLEIVHCAVGLVHTSVLVTGVQVSSRIFMVWFITHSIKQIQNEESVSLFLVVWTVTEITRYSFYTFNMLNHLPYFIKWARWRMFCSLVSHCSVHVNFMHAALAVRAKRAECAVYNLDWSLIKEHFPFLTMQSYAELKSG